MGDYQKDYSNVYKLAWFQVLTYHTKGFVVYGHGQWTGHLMDWRGCNFMHGRIPGSQVFSTIEDAVEWLRVQVRDGKLKCDQEFAGHHSGGRQCSRGCDERQVRTGDSLRDFLTPDDLKETKTTQKFIAQAVDPRRR